ncbi:MAG: helix-turn-helix transcriptional regulator [Rhizobiales bacterium]|nr:helix-turn-helix transcriptional regulator [Hyphomicrobiales bacterium]
MNGRFIYDIAGFLSEQDERLLPTKLATTLASIASFDAWAIVCFERDERPGIIDYRDQRPVKTDYCERFFRDDPFYLAAKNECLAGAYQVSELAPRNFQATAFCQDYLAAANGFTDQIGYLCSVGNGKTLALTLTRSATYKKYRASELSEFQLIAPLVTVALQRIWTLRNENVVVEEQTEDLTKKRTNVAFDNFGATTLSPREHQIVRLLISGESAKSIARILGITPGTTQNHIKHIYLKLGVSSRGELFGRFIDELTQCEAA